MEWSSGISAIETVLFPEHLEGPLFGVTLLPAKLGVILEDPVDDAGEGLQLGCLAAILDVVVDNEFSFPANRSMLVRSWTSL